MMTEYDHPPIVALGETGVQIRLPQAAYEIFKEARRSYIVRWKGLEVDLVGGGLRPATGAPCLDTASVAVGLNTVNCLEVKVSQMIADLAHAMCELENTMRVYEDGIIKGRPALEVVIATASEIDRAAKSPASEAAPSVTPQPAPPVEVPITLKLEIAQPKNERLETTTEVERDAEGLIARTIKTTRRLLKEGSDA